ncbi:MAG: DNA double-strand break repair nuclease NurA [Archaeoglobales archaeon]|nr:DNA double-strand break repair nuclease NurA [Archaeoglobales archaeon]
MWRLSDDILLEFKKTLEDSYKIAELELRRKKLYWNELPEPKECDACGVDGSIGVEKFVGAVFYATSAVAVGKEILEIHEITALKPYMHIDERIRLHMQINEYRIASFSKSELLLLDGTLSGAVVRPPAYIKENLKELEKNYDLDGLVSEYLRALDALQFEIKKDVTTGKARKSYLLARSEHFREFERSYRTGKNLSDDLAIFLEYIEYLHSLNNLLGKKVVFVAKSYYTKNFSEVGDAAFLEILCRSLFGRSKAGYVEFYPEIKKSVPFSDKFEKIKDLLINSAYVRFCDDANILLIETNQKVDEIISNLRSLEVEGYPLPLINAHNYAKIKRSELKAMIRALINASDPEYSFLLRRFREVVD